MAKYRFRLFNVMFGETVAIVEMDGELLNADAKIVDPVSMTLRPIANGGTYTLIPMEDHTVSILRTVRDSYQELVSTPAPLLSDYMARIDGLVTSIGLLFNKVTYMVVEDAADMDKLINPPKDGSHTPKSVEYDVLAHLQEMLPAADADIDTHQEPSE